MSEYCLECFNKYWNKSFTEKDVNLVEDFCEGCAKHKPCVISLQNKSRSKLKHKLFLYLLSKKLH